MTVHQIDELPVLILLPHNRCNCRCLMCDIWRIRQTREITEADLRPHMASLRELRVRWIVFSGGEPLMHSDLEGLCGLLRHEGVRLTLLSAGLLLEGFAHKVVAHFDDVIVSLDGPPHVHDRIRSVEGAWRRLARGVASVVAHGVPVHARCTIQKENCRALRDTVRSALDLGLSSISFLAVDVASRAFNGIEENIARRACQGLTEEDTDALEEEVEALTRECREAVDSGFVVESPEKLRRIVRQFRARLGQSPGPTPRCNAPWVSAVVEADLSVRPCFFHDAIGNIGEASLAEVLNGARAVAFRERLDVTQDPICRNCVCSLFLERVSEARSS